MLCAVYKAVQDMSVHPTLCPDSSVPPPFLPDNSDALSDHLKLQNPITCLREGSDLLYGSMWTHLPPNRPLLDILGSLSRQSRRK